MNFGQVLEQLKLGGRGARSGWNGKDMWIAIGADPLATGPYIYILTARGNRAPWTGSQEDMLGDDWLVLVGSHPAQAAPPRVPGAATPPAVTEAAAAVVLAFAQRDEGGKQLAAQLVDLMIELDEALTDAARQADPTEAD